MEQILEILKEVNLVQTLTIFIGMSYFYNRLDKKIEKLDSKFGLQFEKMESRIDKLAVKVDDLDKRLCRIEGSLQTQGHCLLHSNNEQKAQ
jgi:hypothetical protein